MPVRELHRVWARGDDGAALPHALAPHPHLHETNRAGAVATVARTTWTLTPPDA